MWSKNPGNDDRINSAIPESKTTGKIILSTVNRLARLVRPRDEAARQVSLSTKKTKPKTRVINIPDFDQVSPSARKIIPARHTFSTNKKYTQAGTRKSVLRKYKTGTVTSPMRKPPK